MGPAVSSPHSDCNDGGRRPKTGKLILATPFWGVALFSLTPAACPLHHNQGLSFRPWLALHGRVMGEGDAKMGEVGRREREIAQGNM